MTDDDAQPDSSVGGPAGARGDSQLDDADVADRTDVDVRCPSCGSETVADASTEDHDYRCLDCGTDFDRRPAGDG